MKLATGIIATIMSTALLGFAGLAALAAPAGASSGTPTSLGPPSTVPPVTNYALTCDVLGIFKIHLGTSTFTEAPRATQPGGSVNLTAFRSTVSIPASFVDLAIAFLGVHSLSGDITTLDVNATNTTNGTVNAAATEIPFTVQLTEGQPASFTIPNTPATVGPWTAGSSGTIVFTPGTVVLTLHGIPVTCNPPSTAPSLAMTAIH